VCPVTLGASPSDRPPVLIERELLLDDSRRSEDLSYAPIDGSPRDRNICPPYEMNPPTRPAAVGKVALGD
jgi:hypothetical protein